MNIITKKTCFASLTCVLSCLLLFVVTEVAYGKTTQRKPRNAIIAIAHNEEPDSETVTITLQQEVQYKYRFLDKNPDKKRPFRLFLDLFNTDLSKTIKPVYNTKGSLIERIRFGQRQAHTIRVVLDCNRTIYQDHYVISRLTDPSRIVIKVFSKKRPKRPSPDKDPHLQEEDIPEATIAPDQSKPAKQKEVYTKPKKSLEECIIVIDPGHGGKDPGATGYRGIKEKDVCLAIARELKRQLDEQLKCKNILTRDSDMFLSLDARGQIANSHNADIFISIHANSHEDTRLTGIETYYLYFSSDETARKVAARENFTTPEKISDLEIILFDLLQSEKINKSSLLAGFIHNSLVKNISKQYKNLRNLGVKHAPMRVLINPEMPCILIETAFLSNPSDAKRLKSKQYHQLLSHAIIEGIRSFMNDFKTAYYKN